MTTYRVYDESQPDKVILHETDKPVKVDAHLVIEDGKRLFFVKAVERDEADPSEFPDVLRGTSISLA